MSNKGYIIKHLNKHQYISKHLLKMDDIDRASHEQIKHFIDIIKSNKKELKIVQVNYNNYKKFASLYEAITYIAKEEPISLNFEDKDLKEKEKILKSNNIQFIKFKGGLIVEIDSYEKTKIIGIKKWCISKSRSYWNDYNKNKKFIILFEEKNTIGLSISKTTFKAFDKNNLDVSYQEIKHKIPEEYLIYKNTNENSDESKDFKFTLALSLAAMYLSVMLDVLLLKGVASDLLSSIYLFAFIFKLATLIYKEDISYRDTKLLGFFALSSIITGMVSNFISIL